MNLTDILARVERAEELDKQATPNWIIDPDSRGGSRVSIIAEDGDEVASAVSHLGGDGIVTAADNGEFIEQSRALLPALARDVRVLVEIAQAQATLIGEFVTRSPFVETPDGWMRCRFCKRDMDMVNDNGHAPNCPYTRARELHTEQEVTND